MTLTYKPRPSIVSPFQKMRQKADDAFNVRDNKQHPVRAEIAKSVGTFNLAVTISEDSETLALFKNMKNLIAFRCELRHGTNIIGVGRGASVISKASRYVEKSVAMAANASLTDAIAKATRIIDSLRIGAESTLADNAVADEYKPRDDEGITAKQQSYLLELIDQNISDEDAKREWEARVTGLSREDASEAIQAFVNAR